ncbi:hypothetical protein EDB80DRAFT_863790 [Ilyonectria destructans]|nr:hypothetical protein EDB80DRAFT_863790 [Ilyonectria destructans]
MNDLTPDITMCLKREKAVKNTASPSTLSDDTSAAHPDRSRRENMSDGHSASSNGFIETPTSLSRLENLPSELRSKILSDMPDLPTLRSLVKASPTLHAQYRHDRNTILRACLGRELHGFLVDAYANLMSRVYELGSPRTDEKVTNFLLTYRGWLSGSSPHPGLDSIGSSRLRWLAHYHLSVARPLARLYSRWAIANLKKAASTGQRVTAQASEILGDGCVSLTRSEEIRVFRALYRYETYYHLFGQNEGKRYGGFRHHIINDIFFCIFNPWEADAIGCIDEFVRQIYENIFARVKKELRPDNTSFRQENGGYTSDGSFDLDSDHDDYMDGTISRGLKLMARLLAIEDHEQLVIAMEQCLTHDQIVEAAVRDALGTIAQDDRRTILIDLSDARDVAELMGDPMYFTGDEVPAEGPPLAWVLLWGGKYVNIYGGYVPEPLKLWGHVMWDECRWIDLGAKEIIVMQWETVPDLVQEIKDDRMWSPVER